MISFSRIPQESHELLCYLVHLKDILESPTILLLLFKWALIVRVGVVLSYLGFPLTLTLALREIPLKAPVGAKMHRPHNSSWELVATSEGKSN